MRQVGERALAFAQHKKASYSAAGPLFGEQSLQGGTTQVTPDIKLFSGHLERRGHAVCRAEGMWLRWLTRALVTAGILHMSNPPGQLTVKVRSRFPVQAFSPKLFPPRMLLVATWLTLLSAWGLSYPDLWRKESLSQMFWKELAELYRCCIEFLKISYTAIKCPHQPVPMPPREDMGVWSESLT